MNLSLKVKSKEKEKIILENILVFAFFMFFITSFLQPYISNIGIDSSVFAIFLIIILFINILFYRESYDLKVNYLIYFWLFLKIISLLWGFSDSIGIIVVKTHFLTHMLMIVLVLSISRTFIRKQVILKILSAYYLSSIIIVLLQLFIHDGYHGINVRQVITLFNGQDDPNQLGAILNVAFCFSVYYTFIKKKIINIIFMILSFIAICLTASRGSLLAVGTSIMFCFFYLIFSNKLNTVKKISLLLCFFLILLLTYNLIISFLPQDIIIRLFKSDYGDGSGRIILWKETIDLFIKRPILGFGWGGAYVRTHNTFISMLLEIGLFGTLLFILYLIKLYILNYRNKNYISLILLTSAFICAMFIESITLRYFWNSIIISILMLKSKLNND